jgi:polysaccharide deacetylase 2 family uncharacterized protein YibQ
VSDDLSAPLGQETTTTKRHKLPSALPWAVVGALSFCLVVFVLCAALVEDPFGGEPVVVVSAAPPPAASKKADEPPPVAVAPSVQGSETKAEAPPAGMDGGAVKMAPEGATTVTIIDGTSGKRQEIPVAPTADDKRTDAGTANGKRTDAGDQRLVESSRHGLIPRIAPDGARPADVYAQRAPQAKTGAGTARIAIIVSGLGIGANGTAEALAKLPAPITFAFAPYGSDVDRLAARARNEGHEVLLQVPMEPFDYPDNDPGPQTLLSSLAPEQNIDRLHWLMSRFQGYVGIVNYMGARFTSTDASLAPILRETSKRGLLYVDDGSSPRSLASQIAGANTMTFAKSDIVLDAVPTPVEIDRALARLEAVANERGFATGMATALPVVIERLSAWTKTIEARGLVLVPVTAITGKPKSS